MRGWTIPALLFLGLAACAQTEPADPLSRDLAVFRAEQEAYRVEELDATYRADRARADELTREILGLREEIRRLEAEAGALRAKKDDLERDLAGKREDAPD